MSSLNLSPGDLQQLKRCWSDLQIHNKYHKDEFISRLFGNLLAANPNLKEIFVNDDVVRQQSKFFGDMLSFTMMYIDKPELLDECMSEFIQENFDIVVYGVRYLEPMGIALIQTFRQWLGKGRFHAGLETLWIKVYIHLANCILQHDDSTSDVSSVISKNDKEVSSDSEDQVSDADFEPIQPLRPSPAPEKSAKSSPSQPQARLSSPASISQPKPSPFASLNVLNIELSSNDKYKGFRRSVQANSEPDPIQVKIPEPLSTSSFISSLPAPSLPSEPFDPRKSRRGSSSPASVKEDDDNDEFSTPFSSPSRNSSQQEDFDSRPLRRRPLTPSKSYDADDFAEPVITPRSLRRNTAIDMKAVLDRDLPPTPSCAPATPTKASRAAEKLPMLKSSNIITDDSDDEFEEKEKGFGFDPRRKHSRNSSVSTNNSSAFSKPVASSEESVSEVDDEYNLNRELSLDEDAMDFTQPEPKTSNTSAKAQVFDSNSFGIQGLAPIEEDSDDGSSRYDSEGDEDDNTSSKYEACSSNVDKSSSDEVCSSDASTLSLHNSDYKSSISSGTESAANSPFMNNKFSMGHTARQPSQSSQISYMKPLSSGTGSSAMSNARASVSSTSLSQTMKRTYASSTPTLSQPHQRASLGFMRSSFILKKELEDFGFNHPENVLTKPPTIPAAVSSGTASPNFKLGAGDDESCFDLVNTFSSPKVDLNSTSIYNSNHLRAAGKQYAQSASDLPIHSSKTKYKPLPLATKEKKSFRQRLSSIFSSSSSSPSLSASKTTSSRASVAGSTNSNKKISADNSASNHTFAATSYSNTVPAAAPKTRGPAHSAYKPKYSKSYSKAHSIINSDTASIRSVETNHSSLSGFSFMNRRRSSIDSRADKKGAYKYNVQKVPYDIFA